MSCWTKEELESMLEDVVNTLDLSQEMIDEHGPWGTAPAELVRFVLDQKDLQIKMLKQGFKAVAECEKAKEVCTECGGSGKVDISEKYPIGSGLGFLLDCTDCQPKGVEDE